MLTLQRLKSVLSYDANTGEFTWLVSTGRRVKANSVAGSLSTLGYICITLDNIRYLAHRLAWFYIHGEWPATIDHINCVRHDNRLVNLRDVSLAENNRNIHVANKNSSTGYRGVAPEGKRFLAKIYYKGVGYRLGTYATPEEAYKAYLRGRQLLNLRVQ